MSAQSAIYNPSQTTSAATGDGFSVPRLTTTGRLAITFTTADKGMMVYDTTLDNLFIWNGSAWESVPASGDSTNTQVIFNDNGILAGDAGLTYNKTVQRLTVSGNISIWGGAIDDGASIAVGFNSQADTVAGAVRNTTVGYLAGRYITTGADSVAIGYGALQSTFANPMTGNFNVAVGSSALNANSGGANNVAIGGSALSTATAASSCIAIGSSSLINSTSNNNTAVGTISGQGITTGQSNTAIGYGAMAKIGASAHTGSANVAIGLNALNSSGSVSGNDNVAIGQGTLGAVSTGSNNVCIGYVSGGTLTTANGVVAVGYGAFGSGGPAHTGFYNVALGYLSMYSSNPISGADNIGIGRDTFRNLSSGVSNVAIGANALNKVDVGIYNVAVGFQALSNNTANNNVGVGVSALYTNTTGVRCTAVGANSLVTSTGNNNTAFGSDAGGNLTTGGSNICIGVSSNTPANNSSNELVIGSNSYWVATSGTPTGYFTTASALSSGSLPPNCGFIRIYLNGSYVKIPVYGN